MVKRAVAQVVFALAASIGLAGTPAWAQGQATPASLSAIDNISREAVDVNSGLQLARRRVSENDLVGALSVLEMLMTVHPESDEAILLHASIVCRIDDRTGSMIEFDYLRGSDFSDKAWADATAPCETPVPVDNQQARP